MRAKIVDDAFASMLISISIDIQLTSMKWHVPIIVVRNVGLVSYAFHMCPCTRCFDVDKSAYCAIHTSSFCCVTRLVIQGDINWCQTP